MTNAEVAEQLGLEAEKATGHLRLAFKRAARAAFLWPEEVSALVAQNRPLTGLVGVGPYIERTIKSWIEKPPPSQPPSELRRSFLTLTDARRILVRNPEWFRCYKGDLQMHSTWSDGSGSIEDMAQAGMDRRYEYIAITDHSKGLKIAGGIDEADLTKQGNEIREINAGLKSSRKTFRVLAAIELNLNPRGEGDMDARSLRKLDLVVGSFHSALRQTTDQTARYLAALNNPEVNILGHPKGRVYNYRAGLKADWHRVFATAAKLDKAIEVDCYPDRQDIDGPLLKIARKEGVRIAIDTDAHSPEQFGFVELGLAAVLQAKVPAERVINFLPVEALLAWARAGRG